MLVVLVAGPERRKNLAGKCPPPLIQIHFSDAEFGKISPAGQSKLAVRIPQLDIVFTFLSLRLAEVFHGAPGGRALPGTEASAIQQTRIEPIVDRLADLDFFEIGMLGI